MVNRGEMAGRRSGEKPSSFSVTCSRLSQYLKEKGGFGELSLGMAAVAAARPPVDGRGKPAETLRTMNLLPGMEAPEADEHPGAASQDGASDRKKSPAQSMELFPQSAGFAPVHMDKKPDLISREPRAAAAAAAAAAQMTIFYGGKVVVFDNFPAEKARELMTMAGRRCLEPAQVFRVEKATAAPAVLPQRPSFPPPAQHASAAATVLVSTSETKAGATAAAAAAPAAVTQEEQQKPAQASSDLPIARRVSLHRFLEKRKDRINSKAPYQLNSPAGGCASSSASQAKPEEARQWLGLGPQAPKLEDLKR